MKKIYARHYARTEQPNIITAFLPSSLGYYLFCCCCCFTFSPSRKLKGTETMKFAYLYSL